MKLKIDKKAFRKDLKLLNNRDVELTEELERLRSRGEQAVAFAASLEYQIEELRSSHETLKLQLREEIRRADKLDQEKRGTSHLYVAKIVFTGVDLDAQRAAETEAHVMATKVLEKVRYWPFRCIAFIHLAPRRSGDRAAKRHCECLHTRS